MRPHKGSDPVTYTTNLVIRNLAKRIKSLDTEMRTIDETLRSLIKETAPALLELYGVGVDTEVVPRAADVVRVVVPRLMPAVW